MLHFSIGLITDEEEIPLKELEASPDDRMEMIIFNNLGQYNTDFLVYCGDTEIWSAKEYGGASFDLSPYDGRELMVYHRDSKKLKILLELKKAYKNATDKLAHFFVKSPMPHIQLCIEGVLITALVDTGAQLSIITRSLAEKCGILGRLDSRFQVDAQGIGGVSKAMGKILDVELEFSGYYLPVVLTVFEECSLGSELIIGVDILTAYNASVDFKKKAVRFNDEVEVEMLKMD
ncbi:hypothetical protein CRE_21735 [Caenorhabditis remanei]|uniref:Peptidase A2 domain-containing protein n=1 Tax=Caenorhabditis remanei TaxID=31234 RepID=E3MEI7_CAERE|nr:hypothetical protein CRE_21735 [Caenorhabditis remanei]